MTSCMVPRLLLSLMVSIVGSTSNAGASTSEELARVSKAIASQNPVRITSQIELELIQLEPPGEPIRVEPFSTELDLLEDDRLVYRNGEYEVFMQDGTIMATRDGVDDAYVRMRLEGGAAAVAHRLFGSTWHPMLSLIDFDCDDTAVDGAAMSLLCSCEPSVQRDGSDAVVGMTWTSPASELSLEFEPDSSRPTGGELILKEGDEVPRGTHLMMNWSWTYAPLAKESQKWIRREGRFRVDRLTSLRKLDEGDAAAIGAPAPDLKRPTLSGGVIDIEAFRGRVVVVDFWASWCGPCRRALPQLQTLADELADSPVTVLTVNCFEQKKGAAALEDIRAMVMSLSLTLPVLIDDDGAAARDWGVEGLPCTFIIDQAGRITSMHAGAGPDYLQTIREDVVSLLGD